MRFTLRRRARYGHKPAPMQLNTSLPINVNTLRLQRKDSGEPYFHERARLPANRDIGQDSNRRWRVYGLKGTTRAVSPSCQHQGGDGPSFGSLECLHFCDSLDAQEFGLRISFTRLFCER